MLRGTPINILHGATSFTTWVLEAWTVKDLGVLLRICHGVRGDFALSSAGVELPENAAIRGNVGDLTLKVRGEEDNMVNDKAEKVEKVDKVEKAEKVDRVDREPAREFEAPRLARAPEVFLSGRVGELTAKLTAELTAELSTELSTELAVELSTELAGVLDCTCSALLRDHAAWLHAHGESLDCGRTGVTFEVALMDGTRLPLEAGLAWTGEDVKIEIERRCGIPRLEQRLVVGAQLLHDDTTVWRLLAKVDATSHDEPLNVGLVRCPSDAFHALLGDIGLPGLEAVQALRQAGALLDNRAFLGMAVRRNGHVIGHAINHNIEHGAGAAGAAGVAGSTGVIDEDLRLAAVRQTPLTVSNYPDDKALVLAAIAREPRAYFYASPALKLDPEVRRVYAAARREATT
jgi:hypothetical protein